MPLPHTILDFWQLILENEIQAIVMLNEMDPEDKVSKCHDDDDGDDDDDDELVTTQSIFKFSEVMNKCIEAEFTFSL